MPTSNARQYQTFFNMKISYKINNINKTNK